MADDGIVCKALNDIHGGTRARERVAPAGERVIDVEQVPRIARTGSAARLTWTTRTAAIIAARHGSMPRRISLRVMFTRELLTELLRHMEWADAKVWAAVPDSQPADPRLMQWLVHIHVVQRAFFAVWTSGDVLTAFRRPTDFASLGESATGRARITRARTSSSRPSRPSGSAAPLVMPWAAQIAQELGQPIGPTTIGETCFQVTSHTTYHRGQVNARLREVGAEPPLVDYIAWLWFGRPQPEGRRELARSAITSSFNVRRAGHVTAAVSAGLLVAMIIVFGLRRWYWGVMLWNVGTFAVGWFCYWWAPIEYRHRSYTVDDAGIEIHSGVVWRAVTNVPRSRVQHIDVSQGPLERSTASAAW